MVYSPHFADADTAEADPAPTQPVEIPKAVEPGTTASTGPTRFEYLAASAVGQSTRTPGPRSFTAALIWALEELHVEEVVFSTIELQQKIKSAPKLPKEQMPPLMNRVASAPNLDRIFIAAHNPFMTKQHRQNTAVLLLSWENGDMHTGPEVDGFT